MAATCVDLVLVHGLFSSAKAWKAFEATSLSDGLPHAGRIVLVTHSQSQLVVQRFLARNLAELARGYGVDIAD
ncbi:hypothetical protein [Streptomyces sp. SID9124]|uniref:hypothetical protein n=1 Tax=Streptomyces sp. SID9124 TaxID=2706108 RepID=UPI0013DE93E5|nr:hypothetical protein [Streptomyces sp. SID9124]NED10168.1 hypothetical protein [Streptomyces sp. SID9124]